MKDILPVLLKDGYKVGHKFQYPPDTTLVYSNLTARESRTGAKRVVAFGMQYFVMEYLIEQFNRNFFQRPREEVVEEYKRRIGAYLGPIDAQHISDLHDLGYLPLHMKAIPEGTLVPLRVPLLTIYNTKPEFFWLTNMVETLLSNILWLPITSATTAFQYRKVFQEAAERTGAPLDFVPWQGHDFSFRGMPGVEAACLSGAAHLLSFTGTDTIPAIDFLETYYSANVEEELVAGSVPATEHSVMCMGGQEDEIDTIRRLLATYPTGILSVVSDTWDFWKVITEYLPILKDEIMARDGKLVIRPDSGDPVKIIVGDDDSYDAAKNAGAIHCLYRIFGGEKNDKGFIQLDPHIGLIYGDSINLDRQQRILDGLEEKGFASSNVVLGIGSYTYQYVTRDTYGMAMKATFGQRGGKGVEIFKNPKTDDGVKKSAMGLLSVQQSTDGTIFLKENCTWGEEDTGLLQTVFRDGGIYNIQTLAEIRARLESYL